MSTPSPTVQIHYLPSNSTRADTRTGIGYLLKGKSNGSWSGVSVLRHRRNEVDERGYGLVGMSCFDFCCGDVDMFSVGCIPYD